MLCPACGQQNSDVLSTCVACGHALYLSGGSIDTERVDNAQRMVIASNIEEALIPAEPEPSAPEAAPEAPKPRAEAPPTIRPTAIAPPASPPTHRPTGKASTTWSERMIYADFWRRFIALFIDLLIVGVILGVLWTVALMTLAAFAFSGGASAWALVGVQGMMMLVSALLSLLYFVVSESSSWQATLGKLVVGLKVTDTEGGRLSVLRALGRCVAHIASVLILGIGYLFNVLTARQQTLHDLIAGTLVVHKEVTPGDLARNSVAPAAGAQKVSAIVVWAMSVLLMVSAVMVARSLVDLPPYQDAAIEDKVYEAEMLGARASEVVSRYRETHQHFPPTLDAAEFRQTSGAVRRMWIDAESGEIHLDLSFSPLGKKTLTLTPEIDRDGEVIWRCSSKDIAPQYLPEHCK